jgi:hemerythrin-like domain-containing protein
MVAPLTKWHDEHVRFAQVLDMLEGQLVAFRAGQEPNYELMHDIVYCLHNFADRFHHPREDVAFERMAEHEPGMRIVVNRLLQEHRVIAWAGDELISRLAQIAEDVIVERAAVEAAASTYLVYYRHHLDTEEAHILPRAAKLLTSEDWAAVAAAVLPATDSKFGADFDACYKELRKLVPPAASTP